MAAPKSVIQRGCWWVLIPALLVVVLNLATRSDRSAKAFASVPWDLLRSLSVKLFEKLDAQPPSHIRFTPQDNEPSEARDLFAAAKTNGFHLNMYANTLSSGRQMLVCQYLK